MQRTLEGLNLENDIVERGYHEIQHGISTDQIETLVERYTDFTTQQPDPDHKTLNEMIQPGATADEVKNSLDNLLYVSDTQVEWHKYRTNHPGVGKPDGYTNRSLQVAALKTQRGLLLPHEDPKEFYHFTPKHRVNVAKHHKQFSWGSIPSEVDKLDTAFIGIHYQVSQIILKVCAHIEELHPEIRSIVSKEGLLGSPTRLLFYHPNGGGQLAAGHYDKSVLTMQIAESHRGLQIATAKDRPLTPVVRGPQNGVLFASYGLSGKPLPNDSGGGIPNSSLRPAWHDVMYDATANEGRTIPPSAANVCARWALIFFVNKHNYVNPEKSVMHTR